MEIPPWLWFRAWTLVRFAAPSMRLLLLAFARGPASGRQALRPRLEPPPPAQGYLSTLCLPYHACRVPMTLATPTYSSFGNIYAILDLGCVISKSSALAHRAASAQFVLQ
jgi:hypothetical protein